MTCGGRSRCRRSGALPQMPDQPPSASPCRDFRRQRHTFDEVRTQGRARAWPQRSRETHERQGLDEGQRDARSGRASHGRRFATRMDVGRRDVAAHVSPQSGRMGDARLRRDVRRCERRVRRGIAGLDGGLRPSGPAAYAGGFRSRRAKGDDARATVVRRLVGADRERPREPVVAAAAAGRDRSRRQRAAELRNPVQRRRRRLCVRAALEGDRRQAVCGHGRADHERMGGDAEAPGRRFERRPRGRPVRLRVRECRRDHARLSGLGGRGFRRVPADDAHRVLPDQHRFPASSQQHRDHALLGELGPVQYRVDSRDRRAVRRPRAVRRGDRLFPRGARQRRDTAGGVLPASGPSRPVAGEWPRSGAQHARHRAGRRDLRDGVEPGRRSVRVRQQPFSCRRRIRRESEPAPIARRPVLRRALRDLLERERHANAVRDRRPGRGPAVLGARVQPLRESQGARGAVVEALRARRTARGWRRQLRAEQRRLRPARLRHADVYAIRPALRPLRAG